MGFMRRLMSRGGTKATNNELDAIRDAVLTGAGIAAFCVFGAGVAEANGVYIREGRYDDRPCFKNGKYWIAFYSGSWWLTDSTKSKLEADDDTEDDEEFYRLDEDELLPKTFGWAVAEKGIAPVPRIEAVIEGPVRAYIILSLTQRCGAWYHYPLFSFRRMLKIAFSRKTYSGVIHGLRRG